MRATKPSDQASIWQSKKGILIKNQKSPERRKIQTNSIFVRVFFKFIEQLEPICRDWPPSQPDFKANIGISSIINTPLTSFRALRSRNRAQ